MIRNIGWKVVSYSLFTAHDERHTLYLSREEIGMTNTPITDIREARDIETINMYHEYLEKGYSKEKFC